MTFQNLLMSNASENISKNLKKSTKYLLEYFNPPLVRFSFSPISNKLFSAGFFYASPFLNLRTKNKTDNVSRIDRRLFLTKLFLFVIYLSIEILTILRTNLRMFLLSRRTCANSVGSLHWVPYPITAVCTRPKF